MVLLVGLAAVRPAAADCPITVRGATEVARAVSAELQAFPADDLPCVPLVVHCTAIPEGIEIELRDTLGGMAQRSFATPGGVAAFLLSWSRRPIAGAPATVAPVVAPPPRIAAAEPVAEVKKRSALPFLAPIDPRGLHAEASAGGVLNGRLLGHLNVAAFYALPRWEIGLRVRSIVGNSNDSAFSNQSDKIYVGSHLEVVARYRNLLPYVNVSLGAGVYQVTRMTDENVDVNPVWATQGLSFGARAELDLPVLAHLELVVGVGLDVLAPSGDNDVAMPPYNGSYATSELDVGVRWRS